MEEWEREDVVVGGESGDPAAGLEVHALKFGFCLPYTKHTIL